MILRQFLHRDPVGISYLFGCGGKATCAVVDPVGEIEPYLRAAEEGGMQIHYVIDTHVHADHLSSGHELAKATGAQYVLGAKAEVDFPFRAVADGEVLPLGNVTAEVLHTPGHTPGSTAYLVNSTQGPQLVTGDAVHSREGWTGELEEATGFETDLAQIFASRRALQALAARIAGLTVHPGHQSLLGAMQRE